MKYLFAILMTGIVTFAFAQNQLIIPRTIESTDINLTLQNGTHQFYDGQTTSTMGVNGNILGPTIIVNKDDNVDIKVTNNLGQPTTIHWHGMHVSSENDGGPHTIIDAGATWNPKFKVFNNASTNWYHPHLDEYTDEHVSKGIAGFIIVKDDVEAALELPRKYGVDDIPLVIQTKDFDDNNQVVHHSNADNVVMVNATIDAETYVPAQVIRLRLLNGSSQRVFNFGFSENKAFHLIGTDGGLIEAPVKLTRLQMSPGERAEILVDLTGLSGLTLKFMSYASELSNGTYGASLPGPGQGMILDNYNPNPLNGQNFDILNLNVVDQMTDAVTTIPTSLVSLISYSENDVDENRSLEFQSVTGGQNQLNGDFTINGVSLDMNVINFTVPLNNTEIWTITNNTPIAHPIHLHDVHFYILDIDGVEPPPSARGLKDTYLVPGRHSSIRIITKFEDFANDKVPYMYHCHMLTHEDGGMMGQFVVVDMDTNTDDVNEGENDFSLFPNPTNGVYMTAKLDDIKQRINAYAIINMSGQILSYHKIHKNEISNMYSFPVFEYGNGSYILKLYTDSNIYSKPFVIQK